MIDTATGSLAAPDISVGVTPRGIAITPDGSRAYVTNFASMSVTVIDTATNQVVGPPIPVGQCPIAIAITPDGSKAQLEQRWHLRD